VQLSIHFPRKPHRRARSHSSGRWLSAIAAAMVTKGRGQVQFIHDFHHGRLVARSGQRSITETQHRSRRSPAIALHEIPEGVRYFSRTMSASVRCLTGGNTWEATSSSMIIAPKCLMSFSCQRAGTPRYRHCSTVRNFTPKSRAARSTSCRVRCIVGISIASPFQRERDLRQSVASLLRPKKRRPDRLAATPYRHSKSLIGRTAHREIAPMRIEVPSLDRN
jgi:hypothetical protein